MQEWADYLDSLRAGPAAKGNVVMMPATHNPIQRRFVVN
jgi:hypothetical protein